MCWGLAAIDGWAQEADARALKAAADRVLAKDIVEARGDIHHVFAYAEWLAKNEREKEAVRYLERGLRVHAWALDRHLQLATLQKQLGNHEDVARSAKIVAERAEEDSLVLPARELLLMDPWVFPTPPLDEPMPAGPGLVLVPVGQVDEVVLLEMSARLEKELGIPVQFRAVELEIPPPGRSHLLVPKTPTDEPGRHQQWDVVKLRERFTAAVRKVRRPGLTFLGITKLDIYADDYNFLFAQAAGDVGVVSYARFCAEFQGEPPDRKRLVTRFLKQALASAGHVFDVERCSSPDCARAYPEDLAEHDAKPDRSCDRCRRGFETTFDRFRSPR